MGDFGELAPLTAVTALAGQHQVPDLVEVYGHASRHEAVGQEVVDVASFIADTTSDDDPGETVEAVAFLIAVESRADLGDRASLTGQRRD